MPLILARGGSPFDVEAHAKPTFLLQVFCERGPAMNRDGISRPLAETATRPPGFVTVSLWDDCARGVARPHHVRCGARAEVRLRYRARAHALLD